MKYNEQRDKEQEMRTKKEHGLVSQGEALGFYCGKMGAIEEF